MQTIYDYITSEENRYQTVPVPVVDGYEWSMYEHVKTTTLYLNSQRKYKSKDNEDLPFRNIILPKINLEHRAVQFDLKEIEFYINSEGEDYKAFLIRKWHERRARENNTSDKLDRMSETYTDYGGVLVEKTRDGWDVVPFQRLAFVDQTDMLSGPICQKHQYSPNQLKEMEKVGWGDKSNRATISIDELITLAAETNANEKANSQVSGGGNSGLKAQTPGQYIEVYDIEGMLPKIFLDGEGDEHKFDYQFQAIAYYKDKAGKKNGVTLFAAKKKPGRYKAFKRDEIYGRALGRGGVEELFEPQVWANYTEIAKMELLDNVSKIIYQTADQSFKAKNSTSDLKSGDVLTYQDGKPLAPLNTTNSAPVLASFEAIFQSWDEAAKNIAAAYDSISGEESKSGMPFRLGALLNQEAHSLHQYRKTRLGIFITEIYKDWELPAMVSEVSAGKEFLSCLSLDEMGELVDQVVAYHFNKSVIAKVLKGEIVYPEDAKSLQDTYRQQFFRTNRKFIKILAGELEDLPIETEVNVTGEQKNQALMAEKLSSIFTQVTNILMVNPNFFTEHPEMAKLFNEVIEASGLSALNFGQKGYLQAPKQESLTPQPNARSKAPVAQVSGQPQIGQ